MKAKLSVFYHQIRTGPAPVAKNCKPNVTIHEAWFPAGAETKVIYHYILQNLHLQ